MHLIVLVTAFLTLLFAFLLSWVPSRSRSRSTGTPWARQCSCECLTILVMSFSLELKWPSELFWRGLILFIHLAAVPRAMADPKRTVLKGLAAYWSCCSCRAKPLSSCILAGIQWHFSNVHLVETKGIFFSHSISLQTGKDCSRYLSRIPVQRKISQEKSVSEIQWAEVPHPYRALVFLDQQRLFWMFFLEEINTEKICSAINSGYVCAGKGKR